MGQKVNPHGLRVGVIKDWDSRWFANKSDFGDTLVEDYNIRKFIKKNLYAAGVPRIEIERFADKVRIHIHCAKPGVVIGRGGAEIEKLRAQLEKMLNKVTSINNSTNKNLRVLGILLNKFNRTNVSSSIVDSVREEYEKLTFDTVIPFCPAQSETAVLNQKCCVDDKNSSMGVAFTRVSEEILNRIEE